MRRIRFPNLVLVGLGLASLLSAQTPERYDLLKTLDVGRNPHQIWFSADGASAFIAAAGSDQIAVVDVASLELRTTIPVSGTPLGVLLVRGRSELLVSRFRSSNVLRLALDGTFLDSLETGGGTSLFVPKGRGEVLVSSEQANRLWLLHPGTFSARRYYETGKRPFPPAVTSDGRLAFVPNYDDGTVTVVDLWNERIHGSVAVGSRPSGGAVVAGDTEYAVAIRGDDRIAFLNTASRQVVSELSEGIGKSPFSVVTTADGRIGFVNNTASHDVSVIFLSERRVVGRIPTGEIPIVMAIGPRGRTLWVACEGTHQLDVFAIPEDPGAAQASGGRSEVAVLGTTHSRHRTSSAWGLGQLRETIRRFAPEVICTEIPPDRWDRIQRDFLERGVFEDERIQVFPEYTEVILPLQKEMGFVVEPCSGWTREMNDLRQARIARFEKKNPVEYAAYEREREAARQAFEGDRDDPRVIHSEVYDDAVRDELSVYDRYLSAWIGPGGWTNINQAHLKQIDRALSQHRGKRILITFGAAHKYWFLDVLKSRAGVRLVNIKPFLP